VGTEEERGGTGQEGSSPLLCLFHCVSARVRLNAGWPVSLPVATLDLPRLDNLIHALAKDGYDHKGYNDAAGHLT